jgi:transposase InsO family protein
VNVFPFIEAEKAEQHDTVKRSCELLEVSRSAFCEWHQHVPSARQLADDDLGERIEEIFDESRGTYGWPRVHRALRLEGVHVGRQRVARIMRQKGLAGRCRRRWIKTTISDPHVAAVDLLKRAFGPVKGVISRVRRRGVGIRSRDHREVVGRSLHRSRMELGGPVRVERGRDFGGGRCRL